MATISYQERQNKMDQFQQHIKSLIDTPSTTNNFEFVLEPIKEQTRCLVDHCERQEKSSHDLRIQFDDIKLAMQLHLKDWTSPPARLFEQLNNKLDQVSNKLDQNRQILKLIENKQKKDGSGPDPAASQLIDLVTSLLQKIDDRNDKIDDLLDKMENRNDKIDDLLEKVDNRNNKIDDLLDRVEK